MLDHLVRRLPMAAMLTMTLAGAARSAHARSVAGVAGVDIVGTVADSGTGQPLAGVEVSVLRGTQIVIKSTTDAFGRYTVHNLPAGAYNVSVRFIGFRPETRAVTLSDASPTITVAFRLLPVAASLQAVEVSARSPIAVDTRTGDQTFKEDDYHGAPTTTTSQILQQSIASSARAPTGEVHIRGQHAEYTYYIDGVPVPSGVSGSLNELFDPQVVNRIDFQTGGWDAEYGNKNIAIVNIQTRIPSGGLQGTLSGYTGSFNTHGGSATLSTNAGNFGFFASGTSQATDMRREPIVVNLATKQPVNFHNNGRDQFGFVKMQYTPGASDVMTLELNASRTHFQVPFDSGGGTTLDDRQTDLNSFVNFGLRHLFGGGAVTDESAPAELFVGAFYRHGSLVYTPGAQDQPSLTFGTDTVTKYNVFENRAFNTAGVKVDYSLRARSNVSFKLGVLTQQTSGHENFELIDPTGAHAPIQSNSGLNGYDADAYAQSVINFSDRFEVRPGVRFDSHVAPFAGNQHQLSPRLRLNFFPDAANTLYLYYGRLFVPTNVEDLRSITFSAQQNQATVPTLPERDNYYEAGLIHRFPVGVVTKVSGYYKVSQPGIDDNTVPGSSITTSVNLNHVKVTGLEGVLEVQPAGPLSGGGLTYSASHFYVSTTGIFGSGLTNGITPDSSVKVDTSTTQPAFSRYCTGLFCMNKPFKVAPNYIQNVAAGYSFVSGKTVFRPEIFIDNVFDKRYLLKGAFFSGRSAGRPRSIQVRMNIGV